MPARTCLIINAVWNVTETFISFAGTVAQTEARLEPLSLTSRGGNAVFVTHLTCVDVLYRVPQVVTEETLMQARVGVWSNKRTEQEMHPGVIRSTGYSDVIDVRL